MALPYIPKVYRSHNGDRITISTGGNIRFGATRTTASGTITLTTASSIIQTIDPASSGRNVVLPAEAAADGFIYMIANEASDSTALTIKDDGGSTVCTPTQNEAALCFCDGTVWVGLVGDWS